MLAGRIIEQNAADLRAWFRTFPTKISEGCLNLLDCIRHPISYLESSFLTAQVWRTADQGERRHWVRGWIGPSLSHKLLQNFLKVAPKFFKSCLKLLDFSKKLLKKSCSLSKIKMTAIFAFFLQDKCRWWSTIMQFKTTAFFAFFLPFFCKRNYCVWRSNVQLCNVICFPAKSEYYKVSHRQILTEANWTL